MNFKNGLGNAFLIATIIASASGAKADEQGEIDFRALRDRVQQLRGTADREGLARIAKEAPHIRDCLPGTPEPESGRALIALEDIDFKYSTPSVTPDDVYYCFYLVEPLHRALTMDEGRDFSAALLMREINHTGLGKAGRVQREENQKDGERRFAELQEALRRGSFQTVSPEMSAGSFNYSMSDIVDCSNLTTEDIQKNWRASLSNGREVYNAYYTFDEYDAANGQRCIYMQTPFRRGLRVDEAEKIFEAMQLDMGFTEKRRIELNIGNGSLIDKSEESKKKSGSATSGIGPIGDSGFPYNTAALVKVPAAPGAAHQNGNNGGVQVGINTYITAGHSVIDPNNGRPLRAIGVQPGYGISGTPAAIGADIVTDPLYVFGPADLRGHDVARLQAASSHYLPNYAQFLLINSVGEDGLSSDGQCAASQSINDPFWKSAQLSWFNPPGANGLNGCLRWGAKKEIVHYPNFVNTRANTDYPVLARLTTDVKIFGDSYGNLRSYYELVRAHIADNTPVIGMRGAFLEVGSSGGPLFATPDDATLRTDSRVLAIVTNKAGNDGFAVGRLDVTRDSIVWQDFNYQPTAAVNISSPVEGASYDSASVPNLVASAGSQTSSLRWESDADGYLGSGGNVSVAGHLSPGYRTITATISTSLLPTGLVPLGKFRANATPETSSAPYKTLHVYVTGSLQPPTFSITPTTVYVPTYRPNGSFTYEWHATGYPSIDLQNSTNNGAWQPVPALNVPASGTDTESITAGTTYKFRFLPHGSTTVLGTVQVTAVVAPTPVFAANPVHMVTNGASANTVVTWSALGYDVIDWCGNTNNQGWQCGSLSTAGSGSVGIPVPVGTTYSWRFYPHGSPNQGGTTQLLGELTVDCVGNTPPTFTANPSHIIVPAGGTDGSTIITWNAPTYSQLDWCGKVDSGPWTWGGLSTPPVGNVKVLVPVGSTYGYRFYGPGAATACSATTKLGELTVYATH